MGTTVDKLNAVLASKNAIRDEFALGDIPFSEYAATIRANTSTGGGSEDLYKCAAVFKQEPLRLTAVKDGTKFAFWKGNGYFNATEYAKWKFRTNNNTEWQSCDGSGIDDHYSYKYLTMAAGDWIEVEGNTANCAGVGFTIGSQKDDSQGSYNMLASGDVMSLLDYSDTVPDNAFYQLFTNCPLSSLPDISKIRTIGKNGCRDMFFNYNNTYSADIVLNLQSVDNAACYQMFGGNWWWVTPSTTPTMKVTLKIEQFLANDVCRDMFSNCKYLNEVKFYNDNWTTNYSTTFLRWVDNVASSGTFYKVSALPNETGTSRIPSGWTVKTFDPAADPIPEAGSGLGWNGYKLVKGTEGYTVGSTLTTGLTYSTLIPEVDFVYNADASFKVEQIIGDISGGGGEDEPTQTVTAPVLHMTTGGDSSAWGDYYLVDTNATGYDRVWKHTSADYCVKINDTLVEWHVVDSAGAVYSSAVEVTGNPYNDDGSSLSWMEGRWPIPCPAITMTMETYEVSGGSGDTPDTPADPVYTITPYPASIALTGLKGSDVSARLIIELTDESGSVVDDTVTVTPNNMPSWLTINAQGMIFGNAVVDGYGEFTITLSHQYAQDVIVNVSYTISKPEIVSVDIIPAINVEEGTAITEINLNSYYIVRDSITTGTQIGTATFNAISLPDGLTLSGSTLSGTPTTAGEGNISILATYPGATDVTITIAYVITAKPSSGDGGNVDLLVEGAGASSFNGTYKLVNTSATGNDRVWKHTDNNSHVFFWSGTNKWLMQVGAEVTGPPAYASAAGVADPWEGAWSNEDGALPAPTVTAVGGSGGDTAATGNLVCAGFPEPVFTPMGNINANGVWQLGRLDTSSGTFTADNTVTGTDRAWKAPDGSGYIYYQSGYWYMDPVGGLCMFQGINPTISGTESPYKDDGTSFDWVSMGSALTGATVLPEQGSGGSETPTPVLHFESQEHPALPGDLPSKDADGDYYLVDPTATGWNRVWKHESKDYYISASNDGIDDQWIISSVPADYPSPAGGTIYAFINAYSYPDPWTDGSSIEWYTVSWGTCMFVITMTMA